MSYLKNRIRHEFRFILLYLKIRYYDRISLEFEVDLPKYKVRKILKKHNLYFDKNGIPVWWFSSFMSLRNSVDDLTKEFFKYITTNISKDSDILVTGCGTGWMLIWLGQHGFKKLSGFDYLQNVVNSANDLCNLAKIKVNIWKDDGFNPSSKLEKYDVITALYWVYSAWGGNYGNKLYANEDNQELLKRFISNYLPHLTDNGYLFIELIDSIADFKVPSVDNYPIRHSMEQVAKCAEELGLSIEKKMFGGKHRPRMLYIMKKSG